MRNTASKNVFVFAIILSIALSACVAPQEEDQNEISPFPTETPLPTFTPEPTPIPTPPFAGDWVGNWYVWVEGDNQRIPAVFTIEGNQLIGTVDHENDLRTLTAEFFPDGFTAEGEWTSENGNSGELQIMLSEDLETFSGNMGGEEFFCGSRLGQKKPNPCWTKIGADWSGEWIVWLGPDRFEAVLFFEVDGNEISTMIYDMTGEISEDNRTFTGSLNDFGIQDAKVNARILDNMAQFTGNIMGFFAVCGVRRGGPMPEPCRGP